MNNPFSLCLLYDADAGDLEEDLTMELRLVSHSWSSDPPASQVLGLQECTIGVFLFVCFWLFVYHFPPPPFSPAAPPPPLFRRSYYIVKAGLKLKIVLSQTLCAGITGVLSPALLLLSFKNSLYILDNTLLLDSSSDNVSPILWLFFPFWQCLLQSSCLILI